VIECSNARMLECSSARRLACSLHVPMESVTHAPLTIERRRIAYHIICICLPPAYKRATRARIPPPRSCSRLRVRARKLEPVRPTASFAMKKGHSSPKQRGVRTVPCDRKRVMEGRKEARISWLDFQDAIYNGCSSHLHCNSIRSMHA